MTFMKGPFQKSSSGSGPVIRLNEAHLRHILTEYLAYYHEGRTHLGLGKETPTGRPVSEKPENGKVVALPRLGGLHHRYEWQDAA
jgi:putative transposase